MTYKSPLLPSSPSFRNCAVRNRLLIDLPSSVTSLLNHAHLHPPPVSREELGFPAAFYCRFLVTWVLTSRDCLRPSDRDGHLRADAQRPHHPLGSAPPLLRESCNTSDRGEPCCSSPSSASQECPRNTVR